MVLKSLLIFLLTYFIISAQKVSWIRLDRPSGALLGAVLMVVSGVLSLEEAYRAIDLNTLVLLLGAMIFVVYLKIANFFEFFAYHLLLSSASPKRLLCLVSLSSALLSALFLNDTICLFFTPLLIVALSKARLNPTPYLIALVTSANIGSTVTLTGNPQNMIIGMASGWSYLEFTLWMWPIGCIGLIINILVIHFFYRGELSTHRSDTLSLVRPEVDRMLLTKLLITAFFVFLGFIFTGNLPLVSITGATVVIVSAGLRPQEALEKINWTLLLFFSGLFIVVEGLCKSGIMNLLHVYMEPLWGGSLDTQIIGFGLFSLLASNLVSNVPYVILATHWVEGFSDPKVMWLVLAMSSTFAGNFTVMGSVANIIVMELSKDFVKIGFWEFFKIGFTVSVLSILTGLAILCLYTRYHVFT